MKLERIGFAFTLIYLCVLMILVGAFIFDVSIMYPNMFRDVPRSLELRTEFLAVRQIGDFMRPVGFLTWLTGIGALILGWRVRSARYWILGSLLMQVCLGLFSMAFLWDLNTIMYTEGTAVHSVAFLQQTADKFQMLNWVRVALNVAATVVAFVGFLKFHRHRIMSQS